jgi:hypothetical protein
MASPATNSVVQSVTWNDYTLQRDIKMFVSNLNRHCKVFKRIPPLHWTERGLVFIAHTSVYCVTDNVNTLCTYWLTIDWYWQKRLTKDRPDLSPERVHPRLRCQWPAATVNYRHVLSSERALQNNNPATVLKKFQGEIKIGRGSEMGAWHQDGLADWLSVVITQPLTEVSTRNTKIIMFLGSKVRWVRRADYLTTICEPIV